MWYLYDHIIKNRSKKRLSQVKKKAQVQICELVPYLTNYRYFLRNPNSPNRIKAHKPTAAPLRSVDCSSVPR